MNLKQIEEGAENLKKVLFSFKNYEPERILLSLLVGKKALIKNAGLYKNWLNERSVEF
ncbi:hypothetical protein [Adhaeribacter pallidiroseus]|uniref:hypothetical protein n=1 Tax=Adhaeribacter pallidiroseus TaxID=2072847 RepID=UPI0013146F19|nr:hypothetical protein [Adhaeribacter pallidiroseus]